MATQSNPLIDDSFVDFLLYSVLGVAPLSAREAYQPHVHATFDLCIDHVS